MKDEIKEFYESTGKDVYKQVNRRPVGTTPGQVKSACIEFYDRVDLDTVDFVNRRLCLKSGKRLKFLDIVWNVWQIAIVMKAKEFDDDDEIFLRKSKEIIASLNDEAKYLTDAAKNYQGQAFSSKKTARRLKIAIATMILAPILTLASFGLYQVYLGKGDAICSQLLNLLN